MPSNAKPQIFVFADPTLGVTAGQFLSVAGQTVEVLDPALYEHLDHILCAPFDPSHARPSSLKGRCAGTCGRTLMWSKYLPVRPRKVCATCAANGRLSAETVH